jgi:hypothetical protein
MVEIKVVMIQGVRTLQLKVYYSALHNCRESEKKKVICSYLAVRRFV